jgi:hypothetical protein
MNKAKRRMIGSGIPINQSNAPLPKPMMASIVCAELTPQQSIGSVSEFAGASFEEHAWRLKQRDN